MFVTITPEIREVDLEAQREIYLGIENIVDFPMYGAAGADGKVNFVCPFGLICFPVTGDNISVKTIYIDTTTPQKEITGRFQVDENTYEPPFLNSSHGSEFQIVWTGTVQLTDVPSVFYAVLPAGEYGAGTEFRFTRADGSVITKRTRQPFTVTRARVLNLPALDGGNAPRRPAGAGVGAERGSHARGGGCFSRPRSVVPKIFRINGHSVGRTVCSYSV